MFPAPCIITDHEADAPALPGRLPLPTLGDFPIPAEVMPAGTGWSAGMSEMAQHIGARATLLICDRLGGREIRVPINHHRSPFAEIVGEARARRLSEVYGGERIAIPTARTALSIARRAAVLAMVRAGTISISSAAKIIGCRRDTMSKLVNQSDEGKGVAAGELPVPRAVRIALDTSEIAATAMSRAGVSAAEIEAMRAEVMELVR